MPTSQAPEEVIASRYLKRLGNTFICSSRKGNGKRLGESADGIAGAEGECLGSRKVSFMHRHSNSCNVFSAISLVSSLAARKAGTQQDGEAASTAAANRGQLRRVAPPGVSSNGNPAFLSPLLPSPNTALPPVLANKDLAHSTGGDGHSVLPCLHLPQTPGSGQQRQRSSPHVSTALRMSANAPGGVVGRLHNRDREMPNQNAPHSVPRFSPPTSRQGSSTCNCSVDLDLSECGIQVAAATSGRHCSEKAKAGEVAAAEVDCMVAKAAELIASAAPPRRKLRGHNERAAQVLAQEHSKLLLLVGRRANVEADIEDLLELADAAREKVRQERLNLLSMPTTRATSDVAAAPLGDGTNSRHQDRGGGHGVDRGTSASSLDLAAVRYQLRRLSNDLLRNGVTELDATQLRQLVQELEDHLYLVEEALEEEAGNVEAIDPEAQSLLMTAGTAAAAAVPPPDRSLRQRLQHAKREQEDLLEVSSNLAHMKWLMESIDTELLTDMPQSQPAGTHETRAIGAGTEVGKEARGGSSWTADEETAAAFVHHTVCQSISEGALSRLSPTSMTTATAREWDKAELDPHECHSVSLEATISEPSMVPFSLTDLTANSKMSCISMATPMPAFSVKRRSRIGPKDTSAASPTPTAHSHQLNLLTFMSEVLAQYELEQVDAARLLKMRPLSAPSMRLHHQQASLVAERDRQQELDGAEDVEEDLGETVLQSIGMSEEDGRNRRSAGVSASGARRPPSSMSGAIPTAGGRLQPSSADNLSEELHHSSSATRHGKRQASSSTSRAKKVLLRAQLRDLRSGLLHDLHELCSLHNYVHLIETRRRELTEGIGKGDAEYAAEVEQKLAGHRLQLEAAKRAREEAARCKGEAAALTQVWGQDDIKSRTGSGQRPGASAGSQRTVASEDGQYKRPISAATLQPTAPSGGACQAGETAPTATVLHDAATQSKLTAEEAVTASVETELLRECLVDKGIAFTVVGVGRKRRNSAAAGSVTTEAGADTGAAATHRKTRRGDHDVTLGGASGPDSFLYYELRVEKPLSITPLVIPGADGATSDPTPAPASAKPVAAVVQVSARRLMNLRMTVEAGVTVEEVVTGNLVTRSVTPGAPPQLLLTLTPVKPYKAVSYAHAFSFSAADAFGGVEQHQRPSHNMWEGDSVASALFALPDGDYRRRDEARSSSLDSHNVRPAKLTPITTGSAAHDSSSTSVLSKKGVAGKKGFNARTKTAPLKGSGGSSKSPGRQSLERTRTLNLSTRAAMADVKRVKRRARQGTSGSLASLAGAGSTDVAATALAATTPINATGASNATLPDTAAVAVRSSCSAFKASQPSLATPMQLPCSPPLSFVPRPIDEWGVPHAHAEMEAVERNAVVLTVLQADGVAAAQKSERGGAGTSAVEQLLAAIPDSAILSLGEGWPSSGAAALSSEGAEAREMAASPGTTDAGASSTLDAMATEILCQTMMDGADDEGGAARGSAYAKGGSASSGGFRDGVGEEGSTDPARLATEAEMTGVYLCDSSASVDGEHRSSTSRTGSHEIDRHVLPLFLATDLDASQLSSSSKQHQEKHGEVEQATTGRVSDERYMLGASASRSFLVSKSTQPPVAKPETMLKPLLTPLQPGPLPVQGVTNDGSAADRSTTPPLPASKPHPPHTTPRKEKPYHRFGTKSSAACAPLLRPPQSEPCCDEAELVTLMPPPVVVVKRTPGSTKPYMLLPPEAAVNLLGPSLRDPVHERSVGSELERHTGGQDSSVPGDTDAPHGLIDTAPISLPSPLVAAHSVLPPTGAAAAAAADVKTVSHVHKFLQAIKGEFPLHGTAGGARVSPASNERSPQAARGAAGLTVRTELGQLQEDARELFMMDPVRYDTVLSELMKQVTHTLQQEFAPKTSSSQPTARGTGRVAADAAQTVSPSSPLPALDAGESPAGDATDALTGSAATATPASLAQARDFRTSLLVPSMLVPFEAPAEDGNARGCGLRASQLHLSSVIEKKQGSRTDGAVGGVSVVSPLLSHAVSRSTPNRLSQAAAAATTPGDVGAGADQLVFSTASVPPQPGAQRRETHALVMKDGATDQATGDRRASYADAAAEVERILYEQMKAQLLLRAIISKMKELWQTKQQDAEARHRERLANRKQRLMKRALAAIWPLERQRMIHLHKLIYLLDRQVGRVHGWLPHYSDSNVLIDVLPRGPLSRNPGCATLPAVLTGTHACLASWYRQRDQIKLDAAQDVDGVSAGHVCPRYLHYLPQRRMYHYMRLAKERRMLPLRLVRADIHLSHSRHLLLGYEKVALEGGGENKANRGEGRRLDGWPQRRLPRCRRSQPNGYAPPFRENRYEDMQTHGERERYRRRLQRTATFQSVSKMYSPRMQQDADLPFSAH
uniref:Uncharacterized protein n=1 Tax=Leishmania guyanensis TaxID=5670 RepID=A0A1E1J0H1_LEIGU|nr:hypothetical protein, conserved [Leishmania guyanensis]